MSESNENIPQPSQESESEISASSANQSEKPESVKPQASKIAKPTGLKLPTPVAATQAPRIGRLCNSIPKPAVPPNPCATNDTGAVGEGKMSTSSIRRISDELARRRLTDVDETDENTVPFVGNGKWAYDRKMSSGSVLSDSSRKSDELRKKRASDASTSADSYSEYWKGDFEPRRPSDASVVLTEDTDQFIIGDRVWVGGLKPGQIAYIGETQFAPGEWAGIVLDEPIGKNDGTVANIRYFQCEPKKGIFSRLTRLTRYPLVEGGAGEPAASRPSSTEPRKSNGSLLASVPKKTSLVLTPSSGTKNSVSKPPSPDSSHPPNIQVGDRVIVKSSQGSKAGILRYLGTTDFAAGEWCGVELDDPLGKNDGSVSGTRYFECRPKFGLFAPLHKVSKSPANKRMLSGNCVIHNRSGATTPGIRRQGSKESLMSLSSTASTTASVRSTARKIGVRTPTTPTSAKNALQETLKEKELHIEQLLKERDLERAEVTRAASQADEAERRLVALKQEFEQQKEEAEARISDLDAMVCLLKSANEELKNLLDDERKKYEDLLFRFEEETIEKSDIRSMSAKYEEKIKMLENTLFEERKKMEALEQDSNKLFEAEEQMVIVKDELDSAKDLIAELKKKQSILEQEHISIEAHLTSARAEIQSLKIENESLKSSASQDQNSLRENLAKAIQDFEECKKELQKKIKEVEQLSKELAAKDHSSTEKEKEIHAKYLKIISELNDKHKSEVGNLSKQIEDLKTNSETKLKLFETQLEEKIKLCSSLENQLSELNVVMSKTTAEKSVEQSKQKETEEKLQNELKKLTEEAAENKKLLEEKTEMCQKYFGEKQKLEQELAEVQKLLTISRESTDKQIFSLNEIIEKQKEELTKLNADVDVKTKEFEFLKEVLAKTKEEDEKRLQEMQNVIMQKDLVIEKLNQDISKQKEEFDMKNKDLKKLNDSNEENFKAKIKSLENLETERRKEVESLGKELENLKNSLEMRGNQLESEQSESRHLAEKLTVLEENYKKVLDERDKIQLEVGDANRKYQSLEEKLAQVTSQKTKLESDILNFINSSNDSSVQLSKLNEDLRAKEKEMDALRENISQKMQEFERSEQELKQTLERQKEQLKISKEELEKTKVDHQQEVTVLNSKLEASVAHFKEADLEWKKKMENLKSESDSRIKNLEEQIKQIEMKKMDDANSLEENTKKMKNEQEELKKKLTEVETAAATCKTSLEKKIEELTMEKQRLLESVEKTKIEFQNNEVQLVEKAKKDAEILRSDSEKLRNELKETSDKLATTVEELSKIKDEKNKLNEEKSNLEKTVTDVEKILGDLKSKNKELEVKAISAESENKILKDSINQLREDKCVLDKESTDKLMQVTELRSKLEALEYSKKIREAENEVIIKNLEAEAEELRSKVQKTEALHLNTTAEKNKEIAELKNEINRLKQETSQLLSRKQKDQENEYAVAHRLKMELDHFKFKSNRGNKPLVKAGRHIQAINEELEWEKKMCEEYEKELKAMENEGFDLQESHREQSKLLDSYAHVGNEIRELTQSLTDTEKHTQKVAEEATRERISFENLLMTAKDLLSEKESESEMLAQELETLKEEKANLVNNNKNLIEALERENTNLKKQLEEKEKEKKVNIEKASSSADPELQEEREFQKGQVDFLNSVIVDMQKKNDALKARIEILEMGFSPEDVDEFNLHNITTRSVAPRLFCDICDRFDLHDTEDCPTQANEDVPPPKSSKDKLPPPERPYCEICEVFGHDTADCDDAETF